MAREKPTLLCEIVPFTEYTVAALCRVARRPVFSVQVGDILARDGAWDHKYVVVSVNMVTECEFKRWDKTSNAFIEPGVLYNVTVRNLGRFYSDNRFKPASRTNDQSLDIRIGLRSGEHESHSLKLVQPIGNLLAPTVNMNDHEWVNELMRKYESPWSYVWTFKDKQVYDVTVKAGQNASLPPKLKSGEKAPPTMAQQVAAADSGYKIPDQPPLSPEAILAHFAL
jgi:hypothetical protein